MLATSTALRATAGPSSRAGMALAAEDDALLDAIEKASFLYFWEQSHPRTGLVKDRCKVNGSDNGIVANIAATGFGLTALCLGEKRGWVSYANARERVVITLSFLARRMPTHRGFFFHWANINSGERIWDAEVSSVDTAILLCGILTARQHFRYRRVSLPLASPSGTVSGCIGRCLQCLSLLLRSSRQAETALWPFQPRSAPPLAPAAVPFS